PGLMVRREDFLMFALKIDDPGYVGRTAKFIMENNCLRIVNHAQAVLPQPRAVVGVFIVKGFVTFVESAQPFPGCARSHQKCRRTIIYIPAKHIHRGEWIVSAAVSEAGAVAPYD